MVGLDDGSGALDMGRFRLVAGRGIVVENYLQDDGGKINRYRYEEQMAGKQLIYQDSRLTKN